MIINQTRFRFLCLLFFLLIAAVSCSRQAVYPPPTINGSNVVVDISGLQPELPKFFTYAYNGKNINFFVVLVNQKVISFFDACASCYPHKLGYRYNHNAVVCRECDLRFSVYNLEKGLGGCFPVKITGTVEKGKYLIPVSSLQAEARKF